MRSEKAIFGLPCFLAQNDLYASLLSLGLEPY